MRLTWWGHSTASIAAGNVTVLTDPVLGNRLAHLRRRAGPRPPASVREVDAVVISHLHADHLDVASLRQVDAAALLIVPEGAAAVLRHRSRELSRRCIEVVPGDLVHVGHVRVTATPAAHPGVRGPWSRHRGAALGYLVTAGHGDGAVTTWFAGDTGLADFMRELGPVDAALVPVGGWGLTLGKEHLDPLRAVEAVRRVAPRHAVPIHYGTLWPMGAGRLRPDLFGPPGANFARLVRAADLPTTVTVLAHGGSVDVQSPAHVAPAGSP